MATTQSERIARLKACLPCSPGTCCPGPTTIGVMGAFPSYELKDLYTVQCLNQSLCNIQVIDSFSIIDGTTGSGYTVGDVFVISGGNPLDAPAMFVVQGVTGATLTAAVTNVNLYGYREFYYTTVPQNPVNTTVYSSGTTIMSSVSLGITWAAFSICDAKGTCTVPGTVGPLCGP